MSVSGRRSIHVRLRRIANDFAARVREELSDEKRLVRVFGSYTVLAHLTGEGGRARLHLLNYGNRPVEDLRVSVLGTYEQVQLAESSNPEQHAKDVTIDNGRTEVTVPLLAHLRRDRFQPDAVSHAMSREMTKRAASPSRKGGFLQAHALSLAAISILLLWVVLYVYADPKTHRGSFFGNAIADWTGVVVTVIATKYFYEIGSAESKQPGRRFRNRSARNRPRPFADASFWC